MNKLRYVALAIAIATVIGGVGTTRAAESINQLIKEGAAVVSAARQAETAQNGVKQRDGQLSAESAQLKSDQTALNAKVTAFQDQQKKVNDLMASFKENCAGKKLPEDKYKACIDQKTTILAAASSVNAAQVPLVKQQDDFNARVLVFQSKLKQLKADAPTAATNYELALNNEQNWLNRARNYLLTPAVRRLANKVNCPDFATAPKGISGLNQMSKAAVDCLKKIKAGR